MTPRKSLAPLLTRPVVKTSKRSPLIYDALTDIKTKLPVLILHFFLKHKFHDDVSLEAVPAAAAVHGVVAVEGHTCTATTTLPPV